MFFVIQVVLVLTLQATLLIQTKLLTVLFKNNVEKKEYSKFVEK